MTTRPGRPRQEITRDVLIGARFTPQEAEWIDAAVQNAGQVKSDWIRTVLLAAAQQNVPSPIPPSSGIQAAAAQYENGLDEFLD
jgi:hypothetical protein